MKGTAPDCLALYNKNNLQMKKREEQICLFQFLLSFFSNLIGYILHMNVSR